MAIRQHVLGEVAIRSELNVSGIDVDGLLRRLLLFETVTIKAARLREVPHLLRTFGKEGFLQLVNAGILRLTCEMSGIISPVSKNGVRALPFCTFAFGKYEVQNVESILRSELRLLQGVPGLKNTDREIVEETVLAKLVRPPAGYLQELLDQVEADLRSQTPALQIATTERLRGRFGNDAPPISLRVEEAEKRNFRIVSDIPQIFRISEQEAHDVLSQAVNAMANLNHRISEMQAYAAITGFSESEAPLLFGKLAGIIRPLNPRILEQQFARVAGIADFPDLSGNRKVDVDRLLEARTSSELSEFRDWLSRLDELSDEQIREMVGGVRNKLGSFVRTDVGKTMRLVTTTAVGLTNAIAGVAAGALDTFLVERIFPTSGVFAFLTKTYPSLFVSN